MISKRNKLFLWLSATVIAVSGSGCGPKGYNKRYYVLDVKRKAGPVKTGKDVILEVRRFTIDSAFDSKGLVYRKADFEYESDFYNEFLISPADMVTEKTRTWLSQSGLFARVLDKGSAIEPTHTLEGNITALYGDFRDKSSPLAVMQLRIFLIENKASKESIMLGKTYDASSDTSSEGAEGLVEALDGCLGKILADLEKDLRGKL